MTAQPCASQIWPAKPSLMLKLRGLDDAGLAELEAKITVYEETGFVSRGMTQYLEDWPSQ